MTTFFSFNFGCRVNEAEKIKLDKTLLSQGLLWSETKPNVYIINSCAVTGKAEREVRQHIYQTRKKFPAVHIIVTGCAASEWAKNNEHIKDVDAIIPNSEKHSIPEYIKTLHFKPEHRDGNDKNGYDDKFLHSKKVMIKIQDGCNRYCSYCIVPYLRGKPVSKCINDIITEINEYKDTADEVILTAINTECFGKDTGETLIELIRSAINQTTIPHISFGSIHPWSITDEFLDFYQSIAPTGRVVPFFHIPIQSGSDTILRLMNRGYTKSDIVRKLQRIKEISPEAFIGTDIIVGFPGEGEKEFQETYSFLHEAQIDKIHTFRYSIRPGTAAEKFTGLTIPTPQEKQTRAALIRELSKSR